MTGRFLVRKRGSSKDLQGGKVFEVPTNLSIGLAEFEKAFGSAGTLEEDLLTVAAAIFASDRATPRGEREEVCRQIELHVPVVNKDRFSPVATRLQEVLRRLSNDSWQIIYHRDTSAAEDDWKAKKGAGKVLLFSGGLDSLAAAIKFGDTDSKLALVSHRTHNVTTNQAQKRLLTRLRASGRRLTHYHFFVSSRSGGPSRVVHDEENSQRTRSIVFLVLGALVARRTGRSEVVLLAENGQLAVNLPLTAGRIGAFSTHTAHPDVLVEMGAFLSTVLDYPIRITNPFVHMTKAEVVKTVVSALPEALAESNSCWRNARLPANADHCGTCVPCVVRRIAIESHIKDPTRYARDVWSDALDQLPAGDEGRRTMFDLAEFVWRLRRGTDEEIMSEWPELYSANIDAASVIAMYRRFAGEAQALYRRYPGLRPLVS